MFHICVILCAVTLSPDGETTLACVSGSVQFNCTTPVAAFWTTTGFQDNATNVFEASGRTASLSLRIATSDQNPLVSTSRITISSFSYGDQNATVVCLNGLDVTQRVETRIVVG